MVAYPREEEGVFTCYSPLGKNRWKVPERKNWGLYSRKGVIFSGGAPMAVYSCPPLPVRRRSPTIPDRERPSIN
jgi:hypothetical protein